LKSSNVLLFVIQEWQCTWTGLEADQSCCEITSRYARREWLC